MASAAQVLANRENAKHSTGQRTETGKTNSSANSRKHGLTSREVVIKEDEQPEFDDLVASLARELELGSELETVTFSNLIHAAWTLRRCRRAEADLAAVSDPFTDADAARKQQNIQRYAGQAERSYYRALKELKALQTHRALQLIHRVVLPLTDENGVQQNEPIPVLADVPTLLKTGWRAPAWAFEDHPQEVKELNRQLQEETRRSREEYFANLEKSRQQNEPNGRRAA